jgi:PAS domain S-box-containing protein
MELLEVRVLIVEDNADDAELLTEELRMIPGMHCHVDVVERLAHATALLANSQPDVMLLDLSLPDSHGLGGLPLLRATAPDLPVIIMTGLDDPSISWEAAKHGAQDYLVKGRFDTDVLGRCIRYALERARTQKELREHRDHLGELVEQRTLALREKSERLQEEIEQHRRTEASLRRLATAIENAAEAVVVTYPDGNIEYVNPAFERITGYGRAEMVGQNPRTLKSGKHDESHYRDFYETVAAGKPWRGQFINRKKDGSLYTCETTISPVYDEVGKLCNYVGISRDVSEEVNLREQLNRSQRLESVGQLAGGLAHDFNNILHAVLGFATLNARDLPPGSRLEANNHEICNAVHRASDLIRQLLAFSRRQILTPKPVDINQIIDNIRGMLRRVLREDIDLDFIPGHAIGTIEADVGQLEQILMNLCVNARDAMPEGGRITIETENVLLNGAYSATHPWAKPGRYVLLSVSDTGHGMPASVVDKIFEPFFTTKEDRQAVPASASPRSTASSSSTTE